MEYGTYVRHVTADGARLAAVAEDGPSADIPSCPGWTMDDLVRHVAEVYEHKIACTELGRAPDPWPPVWPSDRDAIDWLRDSHGRLLAMFGRSDAATPSATWWPADQTVGFWARRMAQETVVHRVDGELAVDATTPVDAELAIDGIDEILRLMLAGDWTEDPDDDLTGERVRVATGGSTWWVTLGRDAIEIHDDGEHEGAGIEGTPADVFLWLWGRAPDERIARSGDQELITKLRARLVLATQ